MEGTQQKMPRAAGRIDEPQLFEPKFYDGGFQCAVEDEFLHELGGLQQRITLARLETLGIDQDSYSCTAVDVSRYPAG
jgi:hypothetical protein